MAKKKSTKPNTDTLLTWWDKNRRAMPWRAEAGKPANPYHVLVSEFMLQQTTVAAVIPYFLKFIKKWPSVQALAKASLEDVRAAWAGLGYYRRAKFLHDCARMVMEKHKGRIPDTEEELRALPGIGAYTAAALAAIAFDHKANVVDGNVERVMARLFACAEKMPAAKAVLRKHAETLLPKKRFGDYAQALMDLGATVCTPRNPQCGDCPLQTTCLARGAGQPEAYPRKTVKKKVPKKKAVVFVVQDKKGRVLLRRRPEGGLYAGMWEFPSTPWALKEASLKVVNNHAPAPLGWHTPKERIRHVFSHFELEMTLRLGHSKGTIVQHNGEYRWSAWRDLPHIAMPSLMHKVAARAEPALKKKKR